MNATRVDNLLVRAAQANANGDTTTMLRCLRMVQREATRLRGGCGYQMGWIRQACRNTLLLGHPEDCGGQAGGCPGCTNFES
jgi:hypothetical protein